MNPWLETIGVIMVALSGIFLGRMFSRFRKSWWLLGYFFPFLLIATLVLIRFCDVLAFVRPFYWVAAGRGRFVILALAVTMGLTTPFSRLPRRCEKVLVCILIVVVVFWFSVLPFLAPALIKKDLASIKTILSSDGICFQSRDYTCGPAAAVTALKELGLQAHEGELAILSRTSPFIGTVPGCLSAALENRYGPDGLKCRYRRFDSVDQLRDAPITLAIVRDFFLSDHCVAVLEVSEHKVTIADPVMGRISMSHEQFAKIWRFSGIVLKIDPAHSI